MRGQEIPQELVREFVIAGHGNLAKVKELLTKHPSLLNSAYSWSETDRETAIQAAAQVGSVTVAEYLLSKGAPLDICTAAMLGRMNEVERFLKANPRSIHATGAHGIPLLAHAAFSGNPQLIQMLVQRGAEEGMSSALHNAVTRGHREVASWLLQNGKPDLNWKDYQEKTALAVALQRKDQAMVRLLKEHGAVE